MQVAQNPSNPIIIAAGQTSANIVVEVKGDLLEENHENFTVGLAQAANANTGDGIGQGTIQNEDTSIFVLAPGGGV